jgi:hypothetical protein
MKSNNRNKKKRVFDRFTAKYSVGKVRASNSIIGEEKIHISIRSNMQIMVFFLLPDIRCFGV